MCVLEKVTNVDKAPEGLLEKVTNDDVIIGLGYVCVRNRIGQETYEEARLEEARLFESHPLLSRIDKSIVGIPELAQRLVHIQASIISKCLPNIVHQINTKLNAYVDELNNLPQNLSSVAEAMTGFMQIMGSVKESLRKILIRGEYDEYPDDMNMHCKARLAEMLRGFSELMHSKKKDETKLGNFLKVEIQVLEEAKGIGLPNFLPHSAFITLLQREVKEISQTPAEFMTKFWGYVESAALSIIMQHSDNYPSLQSSCRRAAVNLISRKKDQSIIRVKEIVQMETYADYTCDSQYLSVWNRLMSHQDKFMNIVEGKSVQVNTGKKVTSMEFEGLGKVDLAHLQKYKHLAEQAFDMKMRMMSYWKIVLKRLVDSIALHLLFSIQNLVNNELEGEVVNEVMGPYGGGVERMLEESPAVAGKRERLNKSIKLLEESKDVVSKIMDRIAVTE
ncbi:dynamin-related protein 4C-like [Chenopodium quinoa]|uniref:dynamin-related protein 4C-like n=1 Tax=Chenopodium quinoa TaxID=63459 RepID=UPI000B77C2BC|nr:dynamin-related protein 4C-like [Chenopodium quinoa]XP_021734782.1 dynamin-related protein 4C-like [Chenopodium quinoa]